MTYTETPEYKLQADEEAAMESFYLRPFDVCCDLCDKEMCAAEARLKADGWHLDMKAQLCPPCASQDAFWMSGVAVGRAQMLLEQYEKQDGPVVEPEYQFVGPLPF